MRLSFSNCHLTYFLISSSLRPTVLTQYPFAQKCLPQYRFLSLRCLSNILIAHLPFKKPTTSDTANFGGIDSITCMWSSWIFISRISSFFHFGRHYVTRLAKLGPTSKTGGLCFYLKSGINPDLLAELHGNMTKCMWSSWTFISRISSFFHSHSCSMISFTDFSTAPFKILNRYLGHHTIWYLQSQTACANF